MPTPEVDKERQAAGRRRRRLVEKLTTPSSQLSFSELEPKNGIQNTPAGNSSRTTTIGSGPEHPITRLPYADY